MVDCRETLIGLANLDYDWTRDGVYELDKQWKYKVVKDRSMLYFVIKKTFWYL